MNEGEIVQIGTPVELFERPRHTFVGHFIGSPGMNVLPCEVDERRRALRRPPGRIANAAAVARMAQRARNRRAARIRQLGRRRHPGRHRQGRAMPAASASSKRGTAQARIKLLVARGRDVPAEPRSIRPEPYTSLCRRLVGGAEAGDEQDRQSQGLVLRPAGCVAGRV